MLLMGRAVSIRIWMDSHHLTWRRYGCLADHPSGIRPTIGMELYAGRPTASGAGGTYFFTVNLLERRRDTLVRHVDALREAVRTPTFCDAGITLGFLRHPNLDWKVE